jgi:hypothetical protein
MSAYTSESLWLSLFEAGRLSATIKYGEFGGKSPIELTTSGLE